MSHSFWKKVQCVNVGLMGQQSNTQRRRGGARGCVYLGGANVETQHLGSDFQRLCVENLPYHPETCLGKGENTEFTTGQRKNKKPR